ncbi:hypothetical protein Tco_0429164, partial [Tanacetum coccineum]
FVHVVISYAFFPVDWKFFRGPTYLVLVEIMERKIKQSQFTSGMQFRMTGNVQRFNLAFEVALVQQSGLAPTINEPVVSDRISDHVEIIGTSSGVEQKAKTPVEKDVYVGRYKVPAESIRDASSCRNVRRRLLPTFSSMSTNASELPASIDPHTKPADTNENCSLPN